MIAFLPIFHSRGRDAPLGFFEIKLLPLGQAHFNNLGLAELRFGINHGRGQFVECPASSNMFSSAKRGHLYDVGQLEHLERLMNAGVNGDKMSVANERNRSSETTMGKQAKLTALQVEKSKPGTVADGAGLYLQTTSATARSWLFRYKRGDKERWYGLGSFPAVSLQAAREKAADVRKMLAADIDPLDQKRKQQAAEAAATAEAAVAAAKAKTFDECCREYIEAHENEWTPKHRDEWISTLRRYVSPVLGAMRVNAITTAKILEVLKPHWARRTVTMVRLRNRTEISGRIPRR